MITPATPGPPSANTLRGLQVHALSIVRGDHSVIKDLSFEVMAGDILQVQGPNGAGKTSLFEALVGLRRPDGGRIDGLPAQNELHWIGHKNALNPSLTVVQNLRSWADLNDASGAEVDAALRQIGLKTSQLNRPSGSLSTGQRRRAALSRLMLVSRPWWILDEPLAGLDSQGIALIAQMLSAHVQTGGAVVVSSHQALPVGAGQIKTLDVHPGRSVHAR